MVSLIILQMSLLEQNLRWANLLQETFGWLKGLQSLGEIIPDEDGVVGRGWAEKAAEETHGTEEKKKSL